MNHHEPNKYTRLIISIVISITAGLLSKLIWVTVFQPTQPPSIRLFALWLPLMYMAFSLYYFFLELRSGLTESLRVAHQRDGYTHLGWVVIFLLMICYRDIGPWQLWFGIAYIIILTIKIIIVIQYWVNRKNPPVKKNGSPLPTVLDIFFLAFFLYFFLSPWCNQMAVPDGDEPYILLITHSLIQDGDINLYNNIANKDYKEFSPNLYFDLHPQPHDIVNDSYFRSHHLPFYPALLIPGYAIAGRLGVIWQINLLAALMAAVVFYLSKTITGSQRASVWGTICFMISSPVLVYSSLVYREIMAGLLITVYFLVFIRHQNGNRLSLYLLIILTFFLALIGLRYVIPIFPLFLYFMDNLVYKRFNRRYLVMAFTLPLCMIFLVVYYLYFQKTFFGNIVFGDYLNWRIIPKNLLGLFFDQQWGLLFVAPIYILSVFGIISLYKISKKEFYLLISMILPYILLVSSFVNAFGWASPSPRYLVCILPLLGVYLSAFFTRPLSTLFTYITALLISLSSIISFFYIYLPSVRQNIFHSMANQLITELSYRLNTDFIRFFPTFLRFNIANLVFPCIGIFMIILMIILYKNIPSKNDCNNGLVHFQSLYFSSLVMGFITLFLSVTLHLPVRVMEMEDLRIVADDNTLIYPDIKNVLINYQNNDEEFGIQLSKTSIIQSFQNIPKGNTEISLMTKSVPIINDFPYVRVKYDDMDLGQSPAISTVNWGNDTFIGDIQTSPGILQLYNLNPWLNPTKMMNREFFINKIYFRKSKLFIKQSLGDNSTYQIRFDGQIPTSTRNIHIRTEIPKGNYLTIVKVRPGYEDNLDLKFAIRLNSGFLSRIPNKDVKYESDIHYWSYISTSHPYIVLQFQSYAFTDLYEEKIPCPVESIQFIPLSKAIIPFPPAEQEKIQFVLGVQAVSNDDPSSLSLQFPKQYGKMLGFIWAKSESLDREYSSIILLNPNHEILGSVQVSTSSWGPYMFTINIPEPNYSLTLQKEISNNDSIHKTYYNLYVHKLFFYPDTPEYRKIAKYVK